MAPRSNTPDDFWKNVSRGEPNECWEWQRSCTRDGYGQTTLHGKRWSTHRLAFFLSTGKHPERLVLHKCDNPPCCNPAHLYEGDQKQNKRDEIERGRHQHGFRHWNAVLSDETVAEIRRRARAGETLRSIARSLGHSETTIGNAAHNYWLHIDEPPLPKQVRATVTDQMRKAIIRDYYSSRDSQGEIGRRYGVNQTTVSRIIREAPV